MEKVFGYIRVSTETQAEKGFGADAQEQAIIEYCQKHNLELVEVFKDLGVSGTKADRPGLNEMLISFNGVRKVVILNTSRLWRNDTAKALIKLQFEKLNVDVISIDQPTYSIYNQDPDDFLMNSIRELLDQYDRMTTNMKLARGRRQKAKEGYKPSGDCPTGYKW